MLIKNIAEELLGRKLIPSDGLAKQLIATAEKRLNLKLPQILREFYLLIGNQPMFTSSFNRFAKLEELYINNDKLIFVEENQQVCLWGVDIHNLSNTSEVYQLTNENEWYSEEINLSKFIELLLHYQCALGGYEYTASLAVNELPFEKSDFLKLIKQSFQKVVDHNHLIIFYDSGKIIWYFTNQLNEMEGIIYASARTKKNLKDLITECNFVKYKHEK